MYAHDQLLAFAPIALLYFHTQTLSLKACKINYRKKVRDVSLWGGGGWGGPPEERSIWTFPPGQNRYVTLPL